MESKSGKEREEPETAMNSGARRFLSLMSLRSEMARSSASMVSAFHSKIFSRSG
jgi:hypothetical protein